MADGPRAAVRRAWRLARGGLLAAALALAAQPGAAAAQLAAGGVGARRPGLERLARIVQRRLNLTESQTNQLGSVTARYANNRGVLAARERQARQTLRAEVRRGPDADQQRVRAALDVLVAAQQQRATLLAAEQRELARFLTPVQRAGYLGLQERAFREAQRIRRQREAAAEGGEAPPYRW